MGWRRRQSTGGVFVGRHRLRRARVRIRSRPLAPAEDRINHLEVSVFDISTIAPKANLNFVRQHMAMCITPETAAGEFAAAYAK